MPAAVGIVGVGNMGAGMAGRLLELGWPVRVHDLDRAKVDALAAAGAQACHSAAGAAQGVAALIVCVVDAAQTEDVLFGTAGAAAAMHGGQAVLLCPTMAPHDTERLAARLQSMSIDAIDAPMSGGPARARAGSISLMVACADAVLERHGALAAALSGKLFHVSRRPGDGARTKLVNNLLAGINLVGAAEAIALAQRLGLDAATTLDVIEQSSGQSWIGSDRLRRAIAGDDAPRAHMTLLQKDTRLALEAAHAAGFQGPLGGAANAVFDAAVRAGFAGLDDSAVLRLLQQAREHSEP